MVLEKREGLERPIPTSDLQIIIDIGKKTITFDTNDLYFTPIHLYFGFRNNGLMSVQFNNMKFGYDVSALVGDTAAFVESHEFPEKYISTDAKYSIHKTLQLTSERLYGLSVWCYNNEERFSGQTTFKIDNWQDYYPKGIDVPKPGSSQYGRINVQDPWWI
jgi:hypothetical protein